jgi:glycosyltransferase involved in cell wall biosynthesis
MRRFVVVGAWMDDAVGILRAMGGANVTFTGRVSHEEKVRWMSRASVVAQPSQHEAFGLSLAESMLCGCVPVVTDAGALPWVAGGTGEVVPTQDPAGLAQAMERALAKAPSCSAAARERVLREFTVERRSAALERLLAECLLAVPCIAPGRDDRRNQSEEHPEKRAA